MSDVYLRVVSEGSMIRQQTDQSSQAAGIRMQARPQRRTCTTQKKVLTKHNATQHSCIWDLNESMALALLHVQLVYLELSVVNMDVAEEPSSPLRQRPMNTYHLGA